MKRFSIVMATLALARFGWAETVTEKGEISAYTNAALVSGIYEVSNSLTCVGAAGEAGLKIATGAQVFLRFVNGVKLTATGGAATSEVAGAPGILLPKDATLVALGKGTLAATGGRAGNGGDGEAATGTTGGKGGAGGFGAGAGIGAAGFAGGAGGAGGAENESGSDGSAGSPQAAVSASSVVGTLAIYGSDISVQLSGGAAGSGLSPAIDTNPYSRNARPGLRGTGGRAGTAFGAGGAGGGGGGGGFGLTSNESITNHTGSTGNAGVDSANGSYLKYGSPTVSPSLSSTAATATSPGCGTMTFSARGMTLKTTVPSQLVVFGQAYAAIGACESQEGVKVESWTNSEGVAFFDASGNPKLSAWPTLTGQELYAVFEQPGHRKTDVFVNDTRIDGTTGDTQTGTGWLYTTSNAVLHLTSKDASYTLTGTDLVGDVSVSVEASCKLTLSACALKIRTAPLNGVIGLQPGVKLTLTCKDAGNSLDASAMAGLAAIYCPTGAEITITGPTNLYSYAESEDPTTSMGTYTAKFSESAQSVTPCLSLTGGAKAPGLGGASVTGANPCNGYLTLTNCILKAIGGSGAAFGIGYAGASVPSYGAGHPCRLITLNLGVGIQGSVGIFPRPHDSSGRPLYPDNTDAIWLPAGKSAVGGSTREITHTTK